MNVTLDPAVLTINDKKFEEFDVEIKLETNLIEGDESDVVVGKKCLNEYYHIRGNNFLLVVIGTSNGIKSGIR